ncbi:MAG TPA: PilN domain-containing protein [Edaphobacter sp.]|nr:PilN domain-containing protein [Edaphobacter sp.]
MKISVNLASRPFIELRPLYAKLRLTLLGLAALAVLLGVALHVLDAKAREAQAQMNALKARTESFQQIRQRNEARMRQPQNMAVLERSRFLNDVFAKKSFSWTAVMMDLERVLPAGVQVTSIEPATTKSGDVTIRLRVSGERDRAVELVRNLEKSQRFIAPRIAGESAQTQEATAARGGVPTAGGVEFEIFSGYNPLPETINSSESRTDHQPAAKPSTSSASPSGTHPRRATSSLVGKASGVQR